MTKENTWRGQYSKLDESLKATTFYNYIIADEIDHPYDQAEHLDRAVEIGKGIAAKFARLALARNYAKRGFRSKAISALIQLMQDEHGSKFSEQAAQSIIDTSSDMKPIEQLLILLAGLSGRNSESYQQIAQLAFENKWNALCLYCCHKANRMDETSHTANELGRARVSVKLHSLAYIAYARAAELGATVSMCNMAQLLLHQPIPSAGLQILAKHNGGFDSLDKGFPFEVRAELERAVQEEEKKETEIIKIGQKQFEALWEIASCAISAMKSDDFSRTIGRLTSGAHILTVAHGQLMPSNESSVIVEVLQPFGKALHYITKASIFIAGGDLTGFITFRNGRAQGLIFSDFANGEGQEWLTWEGQIPIPLSANSTRGEQTSVHPENTSLTPSPSSIPTPPA